MVAAQKLAKAPFPNFHPPFQREKFENGVLAFGHKSTGTVRCWRGVKIKKKSVFGGLFSRPDNVWTTWTYAGAKAVVRRVWPCIQCWNGQGPRNVVGD